MDFRTSKSSEKHGRQRQKIIFGVMAAFSFLGIVLMMGNQNAVSVRIGSTSGFLRNRVDMNKASVYYNNKHKSHGSFASSLPSRLPKTLDSTELGSINQQLSQMSLEQVLQWAYTAVEVDHSGGDSGSISNRHPLVDVTSFGPSGMVLLHKLHQMGYTRSVPIITIDTLHLFPETYDFIRGFGPKGSSDNLVQHSDNGMFTLPLLKVYQPKGHSTKTEFDKEYGADLYKTNPEKYAFLSKVEPTLRSLRDHHAQIWITGRRRSQGGERSSLSILEVDDSSDTASGEGTTGSSHNHQQRFKLNPLAHWSYDEVWEYIRQHKVPYNPLHDNGYKSIGDTMTTQPVEGSAGERSGRFVGMARTECGIHSTRAKIQKMLAEAGKAPKQDSHLSTVEGRFLVAGLEPMAKVEAPVRTQPGISKMDLWLCRVRDVSSWTHQV